MSSTESSNRKHRIASSTSREESTDTAIAIMPRASATVVMAVASSGFESLVDDTHDLIIQFVGKRSYGSYGAINKICREIFLSKNLPKETFLYGYAPLSMIKEKLNRDNYQLGQAAVAYNRNDILQWLLLEKNERGITTTFDSAARVSLNTLKRVLNLVGNDIFTSMKINEGWNVRREAARGGRLDVLEWLKYKGWFDPSNIHTGMSEAAENGKIHVIEWLMENGCHLDKGVFSAAAEGGHVNMLKFLKENKCPLGDPRQCMLWGARGGLETIQWFLQNGCSFENVDSFTIDNTAGQGHLHVIQFFIENGFSINDIHIEASQFAAAGGHFYVLKWLHENNCPFGEMTFAYAAWNGNIDNLQWLLENNCPWGKICYSQAVESNKLEVLEWLKEKGCPKGDGVLYVMMEYVESDEVKDWLHENGFTLEDYDY